MLPSLLKNSTGVFAFQIMSRGISFLVFIVLARILGVEAIGNFAYILSLCALLMLFIEFGTNQFIIKEVVAGDNAVPAATIAHIVMLKLVQYTIGILLLAAIEYRTLVADFQFLNLTLCYVLFEGIAQIGITVLNGQKRFIKANSFVFYYETGRSLALLCILFLTKSISFIPVVYITAAFLYAVSILIYLLKDHQVFNTFRRELRFSKRILLSNYKKTYLFFISAIAYQLYFRVDMLLLKRLSTGVELGLYSTAYKFFEVFLFIPAILSGIIFPSVIAFYQKSQQAELKKYLEDIQLKAVMLISFAVLSIIILSELIIMLCFGNAFAGAVPIMQMLFLTSFLYAFNFIYPVLNNSTGNEKTGIIVFSIGFILNFTLNYFFLPLYGAKAAAFITFISELLITILYYDFLRRKSFDIINQKAAILLIFCLLLGICRIMLAEVLSVFLLNLLICFVFVLVVLLFYRKELNPKLIIHVKQ
ncbi:MAG TPA: oligosaccharide flippase family protein [Flavisolibacter sp.]|jgi:O-antigen/teichoic acid export membrane protein|nr:oligosaccharide flippase family protein [Flavisolibacter sp.]